MSSSSTPKTALILIDVYNDFLHPEGKANAPLAGSIASTHTIPHLLAAHAAARDYDVPIFYGLHQQHAPPYITGWLHPTETHLRIDERKVFEEGSWGAQMYEGLEYDKSKGDVVVSKHWNSSSFQNTDLDYQLKQRGIERVVLAGLIANTCLESTARYAYELGYEVTLLKDATASFSKELYDAATELVWPLFATKVLTVEEWVASLKK